MWSQLADNRVTLGAFNALRSKVWLFTEARTGCELELLRKPSPLGDERGVVEIELN